MLSDQPMAARSWGLGAALGAVPFTAEGIYTQGLHESCLPVSQAALSQALQSTQISGPVPVPQTLLPPPRGAYSSGCTWWVPWVDPMHSPTRSTGQHCLPAGAPPASPTVPLTLSFPIWDQCRGEMRQHWWTKPHRRCHWFSHLEVAPTGPQEPLAI